MSGPVETGAQLRAAAAAATIMSPTSFTWFGDPSEPLPPKVRRALAPAVARSHLLFLLRNHLYEHFYRTGAPVPASPEGSEVIAPCRETQLGPALSAANAGRGSLEPGWVVHRVDNGHVVVRRNELELWVRRDEVGLTPGVDGDLLAPGCVVQLPLPKESFSISPGFYSILSDRVLAVRPGDTLVRLYFNLRPEAAPDLVECLTVSLNRASVPFRLKVLDDAVSYARCDTAVLYLRRPDLPEAAGDLSRACREVRGGLRSGVPVFTKQLATGVSLAEDPGGRVSFGEHRCGLVAEGLVRAWEAGRRRLDARVEVVLATLSDAGVDIDRPHLNPGSPVDYELGLDLETAPSRRPSRRRAREVGAPALPQPADWTRGEAGAAPSFLATAVQIGRGLADRAIWAGDRCNWMALLPHAYGPRHIGLSYGALGADLYDGTSGVALVLGELHALVPDDLLRRTALGAIRQALRVAERRPMGNPIGLYTGTVGVALAAAALGVLLDDASLHERAAGLVRGIARDPGSGGFDLLSGRAGAVAALLAMDEGLGGHHALELAVRLGDELLGSARRTAQGWSWRADDGLDSRDLTGLSHGAAGAGHALLELNARTGEPAYREGAEGAFDYERTWYVASARNWPDFRDVPAGRRTRRCRTQWCHGAPGIALTRLHAYELLGDPRYRDEAMVALATTGRDTAAAHAAGTLSFCLCHGLGGNGDVLLDGRPLLAAAGGAGRLPEAIGRAGIEAHAAAGVPWPCGIPVPGRETPGLMLGLAGVAHFYLRLHAPDRVPSLLLVTSAHVPRWLRLAGRPAPTTAALPESVVAMASSPCSHEPMPV